MLIILTNYRMAFSLQIREGSGVPYVFRSYRRTSQSPGSLETNSDTQDYFTVDEVAKAITSPPIFFKPFELKKAGYIDGSLSIRNPAMEVFREITTLQRRGKFAVDMLLSLGTPDHRSSWTDVLWKLGLSSIDHRILKAVSTSPGRVHDEMLKLNQSSKLFQYRRFEVPDIFKDGRKRKHVLKQIEDATEKYLADEKVTKELKTLANSLVQKRRARAVTSPWEGFALGTRYVCHLKPCPKERVEFRDRDEFLDHLQADHDYPSPDLSKLGEIEDELDQGRVDNCNE